MKVDTWKDKQIIKEDPRNKPKVFFIISIINKAKGLAGDADCNFVASFSLLAVIV